MRRYLLRQYPRKRKLKGGLLHRMLGDRLFEHRLWKPERMPFAGGIALGLAIGLMPTYYVQILLAFLLAYALRMNITAAVLGTLVTNPITTPGILLLQYRLGIRLIGAPDKTELSHYPGAVQAILDHGKPYLVGSLVTALAAGALGYGLTLLLWDYVGKVRHPGKGGEAGEQETDGAFLQRESREG
jgi:uncharacterized protein (DUF2062 family)